jgi:hypothetical protein
MTVFHELEPAYVIGDFSLRAAEKGFAIIPRKSAAASGDGAFTAWPAAGMPFYGDEVAYRQTFDVGPGSPGVVGPDPSGCYVVRLGEWLGSVAHVAVAGKPAGEIAVPPYELDITEHIRPGSNAVTVTVVGTPRNLLGPHFQGKNWAGSGWPHMYRKGPETGPPPGEQYDVLPYGLHEPFQLERRVPKAAGSEE